MKHYSEYDLTEFAELFGSGKHWDDLTNEQQDFRMAVQAQHAEEAKANYKNQQAQFKRLADAQKKQNPAPSANKDKGQRHDR